MKKTLYINACVREESRTARLAEYLLRTLNASYDEVKLEDFSFPLVDESFLLERDRLIADGCFDHPVFHFARRFAEADRIVIAAPFWDLSFPAMLKQYIEQVNVSGVTFRYSEEGIPLGLCRAEELYYVTTAGGIIPSEDYGFGYIRALATDFYGIPKVHLIKAEGLDIVGSDVDAILQAAEREIDRLLQK